jgi:hypothetical protein
MSSPCNHLSCLFLQKILPLGLPNPTQQQYHLRPQVVPYLLHPLTTLLHPTPHLPWMSIAPMNSVWCRTLIDNARLFTSLKIDFYLATAIMALDITLSTMIIMLAIESQVPMCSSNGGSFGFNDVADTTNPHKDWVKVETANF